MHPTRSLLTAIALGIALTGCGGGGGGGGGGQSSNDVFTVKYDVTATSTGKAPYPNDVYLDGNGTLAPPGAYHPVDAADPSADFSKPAQAASAVDGFSTVAPISVRFNDSVDPSTLVGGVTVFAFETDSSGQLVLLTPATDYTIGLSPAVRTGQTVVEITPLHPLAPDTKYTFVLTNGIKNTDGDPAHADATFKTIREAIINNHTLKDPTLEQARRAVAPVTKAFRGTIPTSRFVAAWTMTTQSIGASLDAVNAAAVAQTAKVANTGLTTKDVLDPAGSDPSVTGNADVYAGYVTVPYYLDPNAPLTGFWHASLGTFTTANTPMPEATTQLKIPVLVSVPNNSAEPAGGWPVAIFQHGLGDNRLDALKIAETLANAGFATVSIDLPLHGVTDTTDPFYRNQIFSGTVNNGLMVDEPTFDLDVEDNATGASGSDGQIDASGAHFLNMDHLLTTRDNMRQAAADLITLAKTVPTIDLDGNSSTTDFDTSHLRFVGQGLGSGTPFLATNSTTGAATMGMPGGELSDLLRDSPTLSTQIDAALKDRGLTPGTQAYRDFFRDAQTVLDTADPINYAVRAATKHAIHMIEVVGGSGNPSDQVVPNSATESLWQEMGLSRITGTETDASGIRGVVQFTAGDHDSLFDDSASTDATGEMQTEMANFAGSAGSYLPIANGSVIKQ